VKAACLIPAYNEAASIAQTVRTVRSVPGIDEVIVIDDASTDGTADEARSAGAHKVLTLERNLGKGGAMNHGLALTDADILLLLDADVRSSASEAVHLLAPILSGEADMSIAVLPKRPHLAPSAKGGFGLVVRLARWGIRRLAGIEVQAPISGLRAVRREVIERIGGFERGWELEIGLTVAAARAGFRIVEVPAAFSHRATGRGIRGFLHRGQQFAHVARFILRHSRRMRPL